MSGVLAAYVLAVAAATGLVAWRKRRSPWWWFAAGLVGGLPVLILGALAPRGGEPWRSRAPLALVVFAAILLLVTLVVVAISESNLTF